MLIRLNKTHLRFLHKLARKQRNGCENLPWEWYGFCRSSEASPEAGNVERTKQETPTESSQASGESEQHNQPQQGMLPASSKASPLLCGEFVHPG